ncbi:MAG: transposase [Chitinophagaceae bacterium]|nr:transposase [Chitinophagaceae bacterium]
MQYIKGKDRSQCTLFPLCLDEIIDPAHDVRFIDLFAESISLPAFAFVAKQSLEGRPAYHPKDLLKLFLYGYLNGIRSSLALEKQCHINIEVRWLMRG